MEPVQKRESLLIYGAGRLGHALAFSLPPQGYHICGIWNQEFLKDSQKDLPYIWETLSPSLSYQADILLLTISDGAIASFGERLVKAGCIRSGHIVIHTSGTIPSEVLAPLRDRGASVASLHPLQAVTGKAKGSRLFQDVAVGIEGDDEAAAAARELATALGGQPFSLDGVDKALYHAAAVMASNFVVTLAHSATTLLKEAGLSSPPLPLLLPLLRGAIENLEISGLPDALTGPLSRGDTTTIEKHLSSLQATSATSLPLYRMLAEATLPIALAQDPDNPTQKEALKAIASLLNPSFP